MENIEINDFTSFFQKTKKETCPQVEFPTEFTNETIIVINGSKIHPDHLRQAIIRAKCVRELLLKFSSYTKDEIDIIYRFYILSDGIAGRIELHKDAGGKRLFEEVKEIITPDQKLKNCIDRVSKLYNNLDAYAEKLEKCEMMDFCHHFGPALSSCEEMSLGEIFNPYIS